MVCVSHTAYAEISVLYNVKKVLGERKSLQCNVRKCELDREEGASLLQGSGSREHTGSVRGRETRDGESSQYFCHFFLNQLFLRTGVL